MPLQPTQRSENSIYLSEVCISYGPGNWDSSTALPQVLAEALALRPFVLTQAANNSTTRETTGR